MQWQDCLDSKGSVAHPGNSAIQPRRSRLVPTAGPPDVAGVLSAGHGSPRSAGGRTSLSHGGRDSAYDALAVWPGDC
jgi:hypothetical protein